MLPEGSTHSDWEVELGVIIGKTARYVSEEDAVSHIAGYVLANDVSERFNQKERGSSGRRARAMTPSALSALAGDARGARRSAGPDMYLTSMASGCRPATPRR
jgi:2-keto-4-pentenoate hydratase/2-oxohepta-3-ene-1,7-dioic acid hydratase in catechol pathway